MKHKIHQCILGLQLKLSRMLEMTQILTTNFNNFASVLGVTTFGQVGLKSQQVGLSLLATAHCKHCVAASYTCLKWWEHCVTVAACVGWLTVQDQIHELELEKLRLLQENTNLTDQMRELMIECRVQEQDLNHSRKAVVGTHCSNVYTPCHIKKDAPNLVTSSHLNRFSNFFHGQIL